MEKNYYSKLGFNDAKAYIRRSKKRIIDEAKLSDDKDKEAFVFSFVKNNLAISPEISNANTKIKTKENLITEVTSNEINLSCNEKKNKLEDLKIKHFEFIKSLECKKIEGIQLADSSYESKKLVYAKYEDEVRQRTSVIENKINSLKIEFQDKKQELGGIMLERTQGKKNEVVSLAINPQKFIAVKCFIKKVGAQLSDNIVGFVKLLGLLSLIIVLFGCEYSIAKLFINEWLSEIVDETSGGNKMIQYFVDYLPIVLLLISAAVIDVGRSKIHKQPKESAWRTFAEILANFSIAITILDIIIIAAISTVNISPEHWLSKLCLRTLLIGLMYLVSVALFEMKNLNPSKNIKLILQLIGALLGSVLIIFVNMGVAIEFFVRKFLAVFRRKNRYINYLKKQINVINEQIKKHESNLDVIIKDYESRHLIITEELPNEIRKIKEEYLINVQNENDSYNNELKSINNSFEILKNNKDNELINQVESLKSEIKMIKDNVAYYEYGIKHAIMSYFSFDVFNSQKESFFVQMLYNPMAKWFIILMALVTVLATSVAMASAML